MLTPPPRFQPLGHRLSGLLLLLLLLTGSVYGEESFNYEQKGDDWEGTCATGDRQSPIDILTAELSEPNDYSPLHFFNYDRQTLFQVTIDPHTVRLTPASGYKLGVGGGGLSANYVLDSVHFHWPSEHTIDDQRFLLEAHVVHYKEIYNSTTEAASDPEGIAVLAVLYAESEVLNQELEAIQFAARKQKTVKLSLDQLLPSDKSEFFRYLGSLTTPGCSEAVIWTVFTRPQLACPSQMSGLRGLMTGDLHRRTQPLRDRTVESWSTTRRSGRARIWEEVTVSRSLRLRADTSRLSLLCPCLGLLLYNLILTANKISTGI